MTTKMKIIIKFAVSAVLYLVLSTIMTYYQTVIGSNIAVGQLEDSYSSTANLHMWNDIKDHWIIGYVVLVILIFSGNIKNLLIKNKK